MGSGAHEKISISTRYGGKHGGGTGSENEEETMNRAERRRMEKQRAARGLQKVITQQIIQEVEK